MTATPPTSGSPVLLACSHGTSSPIGQRSIAALVDVVAHQRPDLHVAAAFVDVQDPDVPSSLDALGETPVRVVPLLLSAGYHVHVDLAEAVDGREHAQVTGALGPDSRIVRLLVRRLREAGLREDDVVVLAAAGSSNVSAVADCRQVGDELGAALGRRVTTAFLSAAQPRLPDGVAQARSRLTSRGGRVVVATYLLAPGYFADLAASYGADVVTPPLLIETEPPAAELVEIVLDRYRGV
ncbi:sirohydrochlorin chelatase [Ruania halotolerans]|uniref:sirohydrochlorin chelatase n=1 Tax=Ruania halotolerans TaxID=2897773 RepID=UPI001E6515A6|nr:CbiX/SirB N-terminal domain-containing protein [Ruania halotolerans]UFU05279.1 cobalamin biosynthesis protein CbiX [Ruania halotolerans]